MWNKKLKIRISELEATVQALELQLQAIETAVKKKLNEKPVPVLLRRQPRAR